MSKPLSEMSLEELWQLFPISLTAHNDKWDEYYAEMEHVLSDVLDGISVVRISHIGSTAIRDMWAKNIVDIMVEVTDGESVSKAAETAERVGFVPMCAEENRISLNFGYTPDGFAEKVYHLHIRVCGDNDELYFRDYMNDHPDEAKEYEKLKLSLWKKYEHDRDAYTESKTDLITRCTEKAKAEYGKKY